MIKTADSLLYNVEKNGKNDSIKLVSRKGAIL